jgi:pimeloyl-ACP methyl ester carboxylesterase
MIFGLFITAAIASATPCTAVSPDCTEWIMPAGQQSRLLIYRNYPLEAKNETITRALIFVHGINRDADNHFRTVLAAAFLAGALNNTIIVSPRFASNSNAPGNQIGDCRDTLAPGEANWICETQRADSWRSGGGEVGNDKLTSFDFMDEIVRRLARKEVFPDLKSIVVAGHSAGGQFVIRYEMSNQVHDSVGVPISYVVSNPSAYPYVDDTRPTSTAFPTTIAAAAPGFTPPALAVPPPAFVLYADAKNCAGYDNWPYGLKNRIGYASGLTDDQLKKQLAARPVTYLLGESDILPLGIFDASCPAMAQGPTRLARGLAFGRYAKEHHGANHTTVVVPFCGHSARCMFTSDVALPLIFPN